MKVIKKIVYKSNKQNDVEFYWSQNQDLDTYNLYRMDINIEDKRSLDEVCMQELKNAVCKTLSDNGPLEKTNLVKGIIRTMGYGNAGVPRRTV